MFPSDIVNEAQVASQVPICSDGGSPLLADSLQ